MDKEKMSQDEPVRISRLSRIETLWSVVQRAHDPDSETARTAQQQLIQRYGGAIRRYLTASIRDPDLADELYQEFALKFVKGAFVNVDQTKGRFRHYIKRVLYQLIAMHYRNQGKRKGEREYSDRSDGFEGNGSFNDEDELFLLSWREQILERTWQALQDHESETGVRYNSVLRLRVSDPTLSTVELASRISDLLGKPTSPGAGRVMIHRAREKFANLLIDTISDSLSENTQESLEAELIELRLLPYCRDVFENRKHDVEDER